MKKKSPGQANQQQPTWQRVHASTRILSSTWDRKTHRIQKDRIQHHPKASKKFPMKILCTRKKVTLYVLGDLTIIPSRFLGFFRKGRLLENPSAAIDSFETAPPRFGVAVKAAATERIDKKMATTYICQYYYRLL